MEHRIKEEGKFKYIETQGEGPNLLLLHGLFGALSNFEGIIEHFKKTHNVVVPILPIFELPIRKVSVTGLVDYVVDFVNYKAYEKVNVLGNSLGGHISLLYAPSLLLFLNFVTYISKWEMTFPKKMQNISTYF